MQIDFREANEEKKKTVNNYSLRKLLPFIILKEILTHGMCYAQRRVDGFKREA